MDMITHQAPGTRHPILKLIALSLVAGTTLFLQGCPITKVHDGEGFDVDNVCAGENVLPQPHLRSEKCVAGFTYNRTFSDIDPSLLDLTKVKLDVSASTTRLDSTEGWGTITLTLDDGSKRSQSFQWQAFGDQLMLADPGAVEAFVLSSLYQLESATVEVDDIVVESDAGPNTFVAETVVEDIVIDGATDSWYFDSSCDPNSPTVLICP